MQGYLGNVEEITGATTFKLKDAGGTVTEFDTGGGAMPAKNTEIVVICDSALDTFIVVEADKVGWGAAANPGDPGDPPPTSPF